MLKKYKLLRNSIKAKLPAEELNYYGNKLKSKDTTIKEVWSTAYEILGQNKDLSPKQLIDGDKVISSPQKLADAFNSMFLNQVKKLKNKLTNESTKNPITRMREWLARRDKSISEFNFRPVTKDDLKRFVKKMKGGKTSGVDTIDSYSIKIASPLMEDVLEHLINLSIQKFPCG